jgi:hypothetical protein
MKWKLTTGGVEYSCDYGAAYRKPQTYFIEWNVATKAYDRVDRPPVWPKMVRLMSDAWQFQLVVWRFSFSAYNPQGGGWIGFLYRWFDRRHAHG